MENVRNSQLAKFELVVRKTHEWFFGKGYRYNPLLPANLLFLSSKDEKYKKYTQNSFTKVVLNVCFYAEDSTEYDRVLYGLSSLEDSNITLKTHNVYGYSSDIFNSVKIKQAIIFWSLFLTAVDKDFYDNELNTIADLANMLHFTEDMMEDWAKAVMYILDGNMFSEDMDIEFKTQEANAFFKKAEK